MSELFDDKQFAEGDDEPTSEGRRSRALAISIGILGLLLVGFVLFAGFWSEYLWFDSQRYVGVFNTMLWTRIGLFFVFGAVSAAVLTLAIVVAYRFQPFNVAMMSDASSPVARYRDLLLPIGGRVLLLIAVVSALFGGTSAMSQWGTYLLWSNRQSFGDSDPYFGKDSGFYIFSLPWLHFAVGFAMTLVVFAFVANAITHYLYGGIRLHVPRDRFTGAAQAQLSILAGAFLILKAVDYRLGRYDLMIDEGGRFTGLGYTDDNARVPALDILMWVALICAVLFLLNALRRTWLLSGVGVALFVISSIILGAAWPAIVQRFTVTPSEADKERPYIQKHIDATRAAYDIDSVEYSPYAGKVAENDPDLKSKALANSLRLVDPQIVSDAFEQLQQVRGYYGVNEVLDVGQYEIEGQKRDVVLGVRELDVQGIPDDLKNWANLHTVYTHGEGIVAAYGNQRDAEGNVPTDDLAWAESFSPTPGDISQLAGPNGYRSEVYFGESSPDYSVVGALPGGQAVEVGLPQSASSESDTKSAYAGKAGVPIGNLLNKLVYAVKFRDFNLVLSSRVHENSKLLYDRDPAEMVQKVAPWLTTDSDPLPAVVDGKIVWIVDAYTTSDNYPLSNSAALDDMITDSQGGIGGFEFGTQNVNYMRNAVKAVVDAYDGTVTLYAWDESDPMLKAWMGAFPDTVQPKSAIPEQLLEHMRYPEDLFKVQRYQLAKYHVTDAATFYNGDEEWSLPNDPERPSALQPPYRMRAQMPGDESAGFVMTTPYTPAKRENMASYLSVYADASDPNNYGQLRVLALPRDTTLQGPTQMANSFSNDNDVKAALLPFENDEGTKPEAGNLLTLPVGDGLMYVQPIYTRRSVGSGSYPVLQFVTASFGDQKVGFGDTIDEAIADALDVPPAEPEPPGGGENPGTPPPDEPGTDDPEKDPPLSGDVNNQIRQLLARADAKFAEADRLQAQGDTVGWAQALEDARVLIERAAKLAESRDTTGG